MAKTNWQYNEIVKPEDMNAMGQEINEALQKARDAIPSSQKGAANGVAKLDANGKVLDGSGNVIDGQVRSINGRKGDVTLNTNDVGLGNVQNYGIASQAEAEQGSVNNKYMTPLRTKQLVDKFAETPSGAQEKVNTLKNSEVEPLKTRVTAAETTISQLVNEIDEKVSRTEFESLQIGGRNLLINSSQEFRTITLGQWGAFNQYELFWQKLLEELGLKNGDYITLSMYFDDVSKENSVAMRFDFNREDNSYITSIGQHITKPGRYSFTAKIPDSQEFVKLSIRLMPKDSQSNYGYQIKYKEAKLEKGNRATDWSPAPEDIEEQINSAEANAKAASAPISHVGSGGSAHAVATQSTAGFMSPADKVKLDGIQIATQAEAEQGSVNNKYMTPLRTKQLVDKFAETPAGAQAKADAVQANLNAHIGSGGSAHALATSSAHGFMSSSDKSKLDGIQAGAEVNQYAFTHIKVGSTTVSADSKTDTLELVAGTNVVLTPEATNDKITIGLSSNVETTSGAQAKADAVQANLTSHINNKNNPHNVTKAQVGLGSVENYGIATQAEAEAGTANNKYMTPLRTMELLNKKIYVGSSAPSNPRTGDLWIW